MFYKMSSHLASNPVQISGSLGGQSAPAEDEESQIKMSDVTLGEYSSLKTISQFHNSPIGIFLDHLEQLQGLQHFTGHVLGAYTVVGRTHAVPLAPSVDLCHGANTSTTTQVKVAHCGGCGKKIVYSISIKLKWIATV